MQKCFNIARTTIFFVLLISSIFFLFVVAPIIKILFRKSAPNIFQFFLKSCSAIIIRGSLVKVNIFGTENLPKENGIIIAANHSSFIDNLLLLGMIPVKFRFVADISGFRLPFIRQIYRAASFIETDINRMTFQETAVLYTALKNKANVAIYSKLPRKEEVGKFTPTVASFSKATNTPILPVIIKNSAAVLPLKKHILEANSVTIIIGQIIAPENSDTLNETVNDTYFS